MKSIFGSPTMPSIAVFDAGGSPGETWAVVVYHGYFDTGVVWRAGLSKAEADRLATGLARNMVFFAMPARN